MSNYFFCPSVPVFPYPHTLSVHRSISWIRSVALAVTYIRLLFQYTV